MRAEVCLCGVLAVTLLAPGCEKKSPRTALHDAAEYGRLQDVQQLIMLRANVNARDAGDRTPLHKAARNGHEEIVRMLVRCGARIDASDEDGQTPAMLAMQENHRVVVEYLVQSGATVTLPLAVYLGDLERVRVFIAAGSDLNMRTKNSWTPLHVAALCNQQTIAELLIAAGADVNVGIKAEAYERRSKQTPLHYAAAYGRPEIAQLVIQAGANVNARTGHNNTPLHWAAQNNHIEVVQLLLASGAEVDAQDQDKQSPVYLAADEGHAKVVELLISAGADADLRARWGTPLDAAITGAHVDVVKLLAPRVKDINAGLFLHAAIDRDWAWLAKDPSVPAGHRETILRITKEILETLLANGADIDAAPTGGWTPLCEAASRGLTDVVEMLLDAGAGIGLASGSTHTALYSAAAGGHKETAELLLEHGADVNERRPGEDAPLHAALRGHGEMHGLIYPHELREYLGVADSDQDPNSYAAEEEKYIRQEWQRITDIVRLLLDHEADVNAVGQCGDTPLHVAVRMGHRAAAELLIARGADVNARNAGIEEEYRREAGSQTPLLLALRKGRIDIANLLIDNGGTMDVQDDAGQTPLSLAVQRAYDYISRDAPRMMIENYYLFDRIEDATSAPLRESYRDLVERLLNHGVKTDVQDEDENAALHHAAHAGDEELAGLLLAKGADTNAKNASGATPLHYAARESTPVVTLLLEHGTSINVTDKDGDTPLHEAVLRGRKEIVQLLLAYGADAGIRNNRGETARDIAMRRRHGEIVRMLTGAAGETRTGAPTRGPER